LALQVGAAELLVDEDLTAIANEREVGQERDVEDHVAVESDDAGRSTGLARLTEAGDEEYSRRRSRLIEREFWDAETVANPREKPQRGKKTSCWMKKHSSRSSVVAEVVGRCRGCRSLPKE
jgi:hypothetical protein